jgi:Kef-type K+ transport system membrane component KefB
MSNFELSVLFFLQMAVILAACRLVGVIARYVGQPPVVSGGLMELIILNIGYERGIITQTLFSIMVLMAVVTTLMATPIFEVVYGRRGRLLGTVGAVRAT